MATSDEIMIVDDKENSPSPKKHVIRYNNKLRYYKR